jgi:hypothetical protein
LPVASTQKVVVCFLIYPMITPDCLGTTRGYGEFLFTPSLPLTMRPRRDLLGILVQTHRVD